MLSYFCSPDIDPERIMTNVIALAEGTYTVGTDKKFVPFDTDKDSMKDRPATLLVEIQPFLVKTTNDLVLLDTGLGYKQQDGTLQLHQNMKLNGIDPGSVSKVLLSHLHFDHLGGSMMSTEQGLELSFPAATYYVQQGEYENALKNASRSYRTELIEALYNSGKLELLRGDGNINSEIRYEITGGHTEYHQAFSIKSFDDLFFFGGDVLPDLYQLLRRFIAKYDFDGKQSAAKRAEFGERSIRENSTLLFYHSLRVPYCKIEHTEVGFRQKK